MKVKNNGKKWWKERVIEFLLLKKVLRRKKSRGVKIDMSICIVYLFIF